MSGLSQEVTIRPHMPSCLQIHWACYKKTKSGMGYKKQGVEWEAKSGLCQWQMSTFKNFCGCTAMDMSEWKDMTKQIDWWAKQLSQVVCISGDLKCWKAWNTTCKRKAKTSHPQSPGGERCGKRKHSVIYFERMREDHCQSCKHWNCFKGNVGETSERWDGGHIWAFLNA